PALYPLSLHDALPIFRLRRVVGDAKATVIVKPESFNPMWSVKDRIGVSMIDAGERDGKINKNSTIIEPTSGNTGIGLAFCCAARSESTRLNSSHVSIS